MKIRNILGGFVIGVALSFSPQAHADWQANFTMTITKGGESKVESTGVMHAKKTRIRMDLSTPHALSTIIDITTKKVWNIMPAQKMVMVMDVSHAQIKSPTCGTQNIDGCLKNLGFKKTGSETVDGHRCIVYSGSAGARGKEVPVKIWRPTDLKEVMMVKQEIQQGPGQTIETHLTNIKSVPQPASYFTVPAGYRTMDMTGLMNQMMKSANPFKGLRPSGN